MNKLLKTLYLSLISTSLFTQAQTTTNRLDSPNQQIQVSIQIPQNGSAAPLTWSARFQEQLILANCSLDLTLEEHGRLFARPRFEKQTRHSKNVQIEMPFGKRSHAKNHYNERRFSFSMESSLRFDILFRCYDDAIAFRYEMSDSSPERQLVVRDENTVFKFSGNPTIYGQYLEHFQTSHEHPVTISRYAELPEGALLDLPLTAQWNKTVTVAVTEAALSRYSGMALARSPRSGSPPALKSMLTPRTDGNKVIGGASIDTPWRVVLIGKDPAALLESTTLFCLNKPSIVSDTSWIKPDKLTFHWWNGDVYDGQPGLPALSTEMAQQYIDFCARNQLPIHAISSTEAPTTPWYHQSQRSIEPGPDTDVTRPRAGFDLQTISQYANQKGVRLWTWAHQAALKGRLEEAFASFSRLGWSGMMVDFFDHDDQEHVEFAEEILRVAARHRILIHFHGIWKPTGLERTYPHLMNHEGALNLEYLKWSDLCTPQHNLLMAFTRLIAGPMDYHLGGFRAVTQEKFEAKNVAPNVLGTRCHMLAMYVCFDNPAPMIADYPAAYEGQPGFDFLKKVPTWWDDTQILVGEIGNRLVTARRKGQDWYLGGMTVEPSTDLELRLDFLKDGRYAATVWQDTSKTESNPNKLAKTVHTVSQTDLLNLNLARGGGFVAKLSLLSN